MKTGLYDFGGGVTAFVDCEDPEERWVRYLCEQQMAQAEIE